MSIITLIAVLSVIPGGLGISEAGSAHLLMRFGVATASAEAGALALRSYTLIALALAVIHYAAWKLLRRPKRSVVSP